MPMYAMPSEIFNPFMIFCILNVFRKFHKTICSKVHFYILNKTLKKNYPANVNLKLNPAFVIELEKL